MNRKYNQIYLEHLFIFSSKQWHWAKDQFEKLEVEIGKLNIGAHLRQSLEKVFHKNGGKQSRRWQVGKERICHNLKNNTEFSARLDCYQ